MPGYFDVVVRVSVEADTEDAARAVVAERLTDAPGVLAVRLMIREERDLSSFPAPSSA